MRNNTWIIIQREYLTRVKKKTFIISTLLTPLLLVGVMFAPMLLSNVGKSEKQLGLVDETGSYAEALLAEKDPKMVYTIYTDTSAANAEMRAEKLDYVVWIPEGVVDTNRQRMVVLFLNTEPSMELLQEIKRPVKARLQENLMLSYENVNKDFVRMINEAEVDDSSYNIDTGNQGFSAVKTVIGMILGFIIYIFIFTFGAQIMSGVIEEKTNRIIEVLVSSVKPVQLFLGKIIGIALVGLTQFLLLIGFTLLLFFAGSFLLNPEMDVAALSQSQAMVTETMGVDNPMAFVQDILNSIDLSFMLWVFLAYFMGGYLLYAAMFAAIGAAVDNQEDTSQFMWPVTIPLILAIVVSANIVNEPNGSIAFWFSMIPFTSPITMLIRVPFGVATWEILLSLALLILGFIAITYLAAKIYRVGILMYGKKVSYKELWKWIKYKG